jgi:hypothetical protein
MDPRFFGNHCANSFAGVKERIRQVDGENGVPLLNTNLGEVLIGEVLINDPSGLFTRIATLDREADDALRSLFQHS